MKPQVVCRFGSEVCKKLAVYVYRLIDPRNNETFYVGRGKGNRVFEHARAASRFKGDRVEHKLDRIRAIHVARREVLHVIHRHGMADETAKEVEAALIDAYPHLTNAVRGEGAERGAMDASEIMARYSARQARFRHRVLLVTVLRSVDKRGLYDATRYAWPLDKRRAQSVEFILPTYRGLILGAFVADRWLAATPTNFPGRASGRGEPGRFGFEGREAPHAIADQYVGRRVPVRYRSFGNPIRYVDKIPRRAQRRG